MIIKAFLIKLLMFCLVFSTVSAFAVGGHHQHGMASGKSLSKKNNIDIQFSFDLLDKNNATVTEKDFNGKYILLTFGFTHCRHICPVVASNIGKVISASNGKAEGIFVSVDTERDTPSVTGEYASKFHKKLTGLSGKHSQIKAVANNFGLKYAVTKTQNSYTVQHTSYIYLFGPAGNNLEVFTLETSPEAIVTVLNKHINLAPIRGSDRGA